MKQLEKTGSMCFDKIVKAFRDGHSAFTKGKNGKIYFNFSEIVEQDPSLVKYDQETSFAFNSTKEKRDEENKRGDDNFFGNAKKFIREQSEPQEVAQEDKDAFSDLPF